MITVKDRIDFYKGKLLNQNKRFSLKKYSRTNTKINYNDLNIKFYTSSRDLNTYYLIHERLYTLPMKNLLVHYNHINKPFLLSIGDIWHPKENKPIDIPVFTKNRFCDSKDDCSIILRSLNFDRHWKLYYNPPRDMLFEHKKDVLFWRGVSTGSPDKPGSRFKLVEKWYNKRNYIDIGFSDIVQNRYKWSRYKKGKNVPPSVFLQHKYILSVEGNDKDSGLNWKLNSRSLVLMAKPRYQSWLMESKLQPGIHYVLLKDDFSDLDDKIKWCNNNQNACKWIIQNANFYMRQFSNPMLEKLIEKEIINSYFKCVHN